MNKHNFGMTKHLGSRILLAASLFLTALAAQAQIGIEAVSGSIQSGVEVVRIDLSEPLAAVPALSSVHTSASHGLCQPASEATVYTTGVTRTPPAAVVQRPRSHCRHLRGHPGRRPGPAHMPVPVASESESARW